MSKAQSDLRSVEYRYSSTTLHAPLCCNRSMCRPLSSLHRTPSLPEKYCQIIFFSRLSPQNLLIFTNIPFTCGITGRSGHAPNGATVNTAVGYSVRIKLSTSGHEIKMGKKLNINSCAENLVLLSTLLLFSCGTAVADGLMHPLESMLTVPAPPQGTFVLRAPSHHIYLLKIINPHTTQKKR